MITPLEAAAILAGLMLVSAGWLATQVSWEMEMRQKRDVVLDEIDATALEILRMVPKERYAAATIKYNHLRRLSRAIRHNRPPLPPKTYSFKSEFRAGNDRDH